MRKFVVGLLSMLALISAASAEVPALGSAAPGFSLPDQDGAMRRLDEWRGRWLVLYFYPRDDTPGCTTEACSFRDDISLLTDLGAQVVGISVDDTASHKAFAEKYHLPFPLLADSTAAVARQYGALSDWLVVRMAKRYSFIIDPAGRIAKVYLSVVLRVRDLSGFVARHLSGRHSAPKGVRDAADGSATGDPENEIRRSV